MAFSQAMSSIFRRCLSLFFDSYFNNFIVANEFSITEAVNNDIFYG